MRSASEFQRRRTAYAPQVEGTTAEIDRPGERVENLAEASPQRLVETRPAAKGLQTHRHRQATGVC